MADGMYERRGPREAELRHFQRLIDERRNTSRKESDMAKKVMLIGAKVVWIIPFSCSFCPSDGLLVFSRHILDESVLFTGPQRTGSVAR